MITSDEIAEKIFTLRRPQYSKTTSPVISKAEEEINSYLKRRDIESTANPKNIGEILIVFIHGFAASKYCWLDPDIGNMGWVKNYWDDPLPRDFGWHAIPPIPFIPVDWTLSKQLAPIGATEIMDRYNIEWLTYSQKSAFGDIDVSIKELVNVMDGIKKIYGDRRIVIIAHSRGGLVSKRYIDIADKTNIEKLITFGTPFGGTFMSSVEIFRLPSKYFLNKVRFARRLWDISQERKVETIATKQLAPNSEFLTRLAKAGCRKGIKYINIAGSCSHITNVYNWKWKMTSFVRNPKLAKIKMIEKIDLIKNKHPPIEWYNLPNNNRIHAFNWFLEPTKIMEVYPKIGYPEVLQGDGAVSIRNALMTEPQVKHYIIHRNHIDMTCTKEAYDIMLREVYQQKKEKE